MELLNFEDDEQIDSIHTGAYYVNLYNETLPIRIYNHIKDMKFNDAINFYKYVQEILNKCTSLYLFQGDIVYFYPSIHQQKALSPTSCFVSGAPIASGEYYYTYRPLLENISSGKVYTIQRTLKVSSGYEWILPYDLHSFEELVSNFELGLDLNGVSYYDFQINAGSNALNLKQLSKNKRF